ncbi:MAG: cell division protein FtsZ [Elusimicrobia bacterium]|nr:cell division protein FtsZ [Elusimicrobiota bacterium]
MVRIKAAEDLRELRAVIKVVGLGGAGGNAINRMVEAGVRDVELIAANADAQDLRRSQAALRIQIGESLTKGLGVGGDPSKGQMAALESKEQLREVVQGADLIFITAGMGGGTGTGAAPVVAQLAKEANALTIGVVTRPFSFEGRVRELQAEAGIQELRQHVDTLLIIPNDSLFTVTDDKTHAAEAYRKADDVLRQAVQGISDVITTPGDINMDMNDIRSIMANAGEAHMGVGTGTGPNRALEAAKAAISSPLLENVSIDGARGMLVNIVGNRQMTLAELTEAMKFIQAKGSPEAKIKYGQAYDDSMGERLRITVIATGFPARRARSAPRGALRAPGLHRRSPLPDIPGLDAPEPARPQPTDWSKPAFLHFKLKKLKS